MTTTDPKLIERIARSLYEEDDVWSTAFPWPNCEGLGATDAYRRLATAILPIVAAAINEAAQKERAGIVAWLRAYDRDETNWPQFLANAIERGDHAAIEAHKESQHG